MPIAKLAKKARKARARKRRSEEVGENERRAKFIEKI
jgi:hypothetical protein